MNTNFKQIVDKLQDNSNPFMSSTVSDLSVQTDRKEKQTEYDKYITWKNPEMPEGWITSDRVNEILGK